MCGSQVEVQTGSEPGLRGEIITLPRKSVLQASKGPTAQVAMQQVTKMVCDAVDVAYSENVEAQFLNTAGARRKFLSSESMVDVRKKLTRTAVIRLVVKGD
jgi:hypothetical protein